jgi:hypothetical protein
MKFFYLTLAIVFFSVPSFSQDDLLKMMDNSPADKEFNKVTATFKTLKVNNMQTTQTVGAGELDFRITHRFGNIGKASGGGIHTLYGWDAISDVRFSFDYGISRTFQVGVARNKRSENLDGSIKWRFLEQTLDNKIPFSVCLYSIASLTPMTKSAFYSGAEASWIASNAKFSHRMAYTSQVVIASKLANWLSIVAAPTYTHLNYVLADYNSETGATKENDIFSAAAGVRLKLTRSVSILADYYYVLSPFRKNNPKTQYYNPLSLGIEIETGGHVFHMNLTNAAGIIENNFIPNTTDTWTKGGYKFGFNISRVFQVCKKK